MKKLVCAALGIALIGCVVEDSAPPPTITFTWGAGGCPDLTAAARESAVVIRGDDADGFAAPEELIFDCEDGGSGIIDIQDGDWDFAIDVVDQYSDSASIDPIDCFDPVFGEDCLYYTLEPSLSPPINTFFDYEPDVLVDFAYSYGNFTVDYQIDGLDPSESQCGGFGEDGATEFRVAMSFYDGAGRVDDLFVCGANPVDTRDIPTGIYEPFFDLLDFTGTPINVDPAIPNTPGGEVSLDSHLENVVILVDISEF